MNQIHQGNEISISEVITKIIEWARFIKTKIVIVFSVTIIMALFFFANAFYKKPLYVATVSFALEEEQSGGMGGALGLASQFGFDLGSNAGGAFSSSNLLELMKSRSLIEKTLLSKINFQNKQISLADYYLYLQNTEDQNEKGLLFNDKNRENFSRSQDSILGGIYNTILEKNLLVSQKDKKVSIYYIDVESIDPLFSKLFAENLAHVVSDFYIETKTKRSAQNVAILQRQTDSVRAELNNAIAGVTKRTDETFNLNPALNSARVPSMRRQIDVQANTAILTQLVGNLELSKVALRKQTPLIQIIDMPILPLPVKKEGKLSALISGGSLGFTLVILFLSVYRWVSLLIKNNRSLLKQQA